MRTRRRELRSAATCGSRWRRKPAWLRAEREKVTVPNLLISAALSGESESPTERRAAMAELMAVHTLLARSSNNVNQIARHANAGEEFPRGRRKQLGHMREVAMRIDRTIEGLM